MAWSATFMEIDARVPGGCSASWTNTKVLGLPVNCLERPTKRAFAEHASARGAWSGGGARVHVRRISGEPCRHGFVDVDRWPDSIWARGRRINRQGLRRE